MTAKKLEIYMELLICQKYAQATTLLSKLSVNLYGTTRILHCLWNAFSLIPERGKAQIGPTYASWQSLRSFAGARTRSLHANGNSQLAALPIPLRRAARERAQLAQHTCIAGIMMPQGPITHSCFCGFLGHGTTR
jgi:hypothetical protein